MSELIVPKNARPVDSSFGAPLEPIGNPLTAGIDQQVHAGRKGGGRRPDGGRSFA